MHDITIPPAFVKQADQDFVIAVTSGNEAVAEALIALGFSKSKDDEYRVVSKSESEKVRLFARLRELGFCFARGREWNPAEVFEYLRDSGLINGKFTEIAWVRPNEWRTRLV